MSNERIIFIDIFYWCVDCEFIIIYFLLFFLNNCFIKFGWLVKFRLLLWDGGGGGLFWLGWIVWIELMDLFWRCFLCFIWIVFCLFWWIFWVCCVLESWWIFVWVCWFCVVWMILLVKFCNLLMVMDFSCECCFLIVLIVFWICLVFY